MNNGIKSKERVKKHGEVFTSDSIVCDMLDLIDDNNLYTTYLEPTCGDGQFIVRILYNKLLKFNSTNTNNKELELIKILTTIYGVDILQDNISICKQRCLDLLLGKEVETFTLNNKTNKIIIDVGISIDDTLKNIIIDILDNNIIQGNTLDRNGIEFKHYYFNNDNVKIKLFNLQEQDFEYSETQEVNYRELSSLIKEVNNIELKF